MTTQVTTNNQQTTFKNVAINIGNHLAKEAIWDGNRCNWIGHTVDSVNGSYQVLRKSFGRDFYNGTSGIAFFLALLQQYHTDPILEETLEGTMNQVLSLTEENDQLGSNYGFHGGRIGLAYALIEVGKMRQREEWSAAGHQMLEDICHREIGENELDIIAGIAGGIPVLLKYHAETGKQLLLDTAVKGGDFLLRRAEKGPQGWGWKIPMSSAPLTGYSHGNAGIALALLELYRVTERPDFYTAAMYGFNYERMLFNPTVQNWPDLRELGTGPNPTPIYGESWCHGAPGIALSRLRAWEITGDATFRQEAEIALGTTYKSVYNMLTVYRDSANFSLCHGLAGNADIVLEGNNQLPNPLYQQLVEQAGQLGVELFDKTGLSWTSGVNDPTGATKGMGETPGFMLGLAGTGYFYLRLAFPKEVPCMLVV